MSRQLHSVDGDPGVTEKVDVDTNGSPHAFLRVLPQVHYWPRDTFLPLGDIMWSPGRDQPPLVHLVAPSYESDDALAHPVRFEWQGDSATKVWTPTVIQVGPIIVPGPGKTYTVPGNIHFWRMIPPPGYVALGYCFTRTPTPPDCWNYYCVKEDHLVRVGTRTRWSDAGTGWAYHSLNVYEGVIGPETTPGLGRELRLPFTVKGHCTMDSGHPDAGDPGFYALNLPPGKWPTTQAEPPLEPGGGWAATTRK